MGVNDSSFCGAWAQGYELYDKAFICLYSIMNIYLLTYTIWYIYIQERRVKA
jgi:hypothetical protein